MILTVLVAVGAMTAYVVHKTAVYQATAELELTPQVSVAVLQANNSTANSAQGLVDVPTAIQVIQSQSVAARVSAQIRGAPSVSASQVGTTNVVSLAVRSTDPRLAARVANAYGNEYIALQRNASASALGNAIRVLQSRISSLQTNATRIQRQAASARGSQALALDAQLSSILQTENSLRSEISVYETAAALSTGGGQLVGAASVPTSPVVPKPAEYIILAAILGLLAGAALALLQDNLDDDVRSPDDLKPTLGSIPCLGVLPNIASRRRGAPSASRQLIARDAPRSPQAEAYRILRTSIKFLQVDRNLKIIQVTSPKAGDGKTTTIANLAVTMSNAGQRVVVVDCDLRRPRLHAIFEIANDVGFTSALIGETSVTAACTSIEGLPGLQVMASGPVPPFPAEMLSSASVERVLNALVDEYDIVLIDSPPVLPVADATVLASHVEAVVLVASAGLSTRKDIGKAIGALGRVQAPLRGFILNRVRHESSGYGDGYGYGYGGGDVDELNDSASPVEAVNGTAPHLAKS